MDGTHQPDQRLRGEVTRSIVATLQRESIRNELTIARARVVLMLGALLVEVHLIVDGSGLGDAIYPLASLTVVMFLASVALWRALERGYWSPSLPAVVPVVDMFYFCGRLGGSVALLGPDHFIDVQDLATVVGMSALMMTSGALRLSSRAVAWAIFWGVAIYVSFAWWIGLHTFFITVHMILLMGVGLTAMGLTRIVDRAVHSEITRLTVGRLLPRPVLEALDEDPVRLLSEPRAMEVTVLVSDLRGFTTWSEDKAPLDVLAFLNAIQGALADVVMRHHGTVDKFMGDGMLAVFGAPTSLERHADHAIEAAREMQEVLRSMDCPIRMGIGIHSGEVVVGCLGAGVRLEFTVLGDTVNTASRLEAKTKELGVGVVVSGQTAARTRLPLRSLGRVELRGKSGPVEVYGLALESLS